MDQTKGWPFDQAQNVATVVSKQVLNRSLPILHVTHYEDDHSWSFLNGTEDYDVVLRLVCMAEILGLYESIRVIADLPPGWSASREAIASNWIRKPTPPEEEP